MSWMQQSGIWTRIQIFDWILLPQIPWIKLGTQDFNFQEGLKPKFCVWISQVSLNIYPNSVGIIFLLVIENFVFFYIICIHDL